MELSAQQVKEVNSVIEKIEKAITPGAEIGAQSRPTLTQLLKANKVEKKPKFFECKREYSNIIVSHFVTEKSLKRSRFDSKGQATIFLIPN